MLHNLETFSVAVRAFTVLECTLAVLHNLHASPDSFSERASDALYYLDAVLYYLHVLTTSCIVLPTCINYMMYSITYMY